MSRDELVAEVKRLRAGIREHRDSSGQELCWHHPKLWGLVPERVEPAIEVPAWPQFLRGCVTYRESLDTQRPDAPRSEREFGDHDEPRSAGRVHPSAMRAARDTVLEYLRAVESHDLDRVATCLHADVEVVEHPNKLNPNGATYDRAALRAAGERGAALMASERYEVRALTCERAGDVDRVVAQIAWTGTLKDGRSMRAEICSVIELRDGLVYRQEQYDCFRS